MRAADLRRLRGKADAAWKAEVGREVERIIALKEPAARMAAHAELSRVLAEDGEALPPDATDRVFRSLRLDAEAVEREGRRREWEAQRAAELRLDRLRPWAAWLGVPLAAGLPAAAALGAAGWGPLAVLVAALEAPWLPRLPVLGVVAGACGVGVGAWLTAGARSGRTLGAGLAGAFAAGAFAVAAARPLPVHLAGPGARLSDGSGIGGSVVRVERRWPDHPDRLHVLLGAGRVSRGDVLHLQGGQPVRFLRGG